RQAGRLCSVVLRVVIFGRVWKKTAKKRFAGFATLIFGEQTEKTAENMQPRRWLKKSKTSGKANPDSRLWFVPAASRCCNWMKIWYKSCTKQVLKSLLKQTERSRRRRELT